MEGGHAAGSVQLDSAAGAWLSVPVSRAAACPQQAASWRLAVVLLTPSFYKHHRAVPVYTKSSLDALIFTLRCKPYSDMASGLKTRDDKIQLESTHAKVRIEGQQ